MSAGLFSPPGPPAPDYSGATVVPFAFPGHSPKGPLWKFGTGFDVSVRCACGVWIALEAPADGEVGGHTVDRDTGLVRPSIWHDDPSCGWHITARLDGFAARLREAAERYLDGY